MEQLKVGASKLVIVVCSEKGGVRKTSSAIMAGEYLRNEAFDVRFIQIDEQTRLQALYREYVTTIGLPPPEEMRGDDLADTKALSPVLAALKRSEMAVSIIDVGANFDRRFFEWCAAMELAKSLDALKTTIVGVIPILSDADSQRGGARTAARFVEAFPDGELVVVVCEDGVDVIGTGWNEVAAIFDKELSETQKFDQLKVIRHPRLLPGALSVLQSTGLTPPEFAMTPPEELVKLTGRDEAIVRQVRSDVILYIARFFKELKKVFPLAA